MEKDELETGEGLHFLISNRYRKLSVNIPTIIVKESAQGLTWRNLRLKNNRQKKLAMNLNVLVY